MDEQFLSQISDDEARGFINFMNNLVGDQDVYYNGTLARELRHQGIDEAIRLWGGLEQAYLKLRVVEEQFGDLPCRLGREVMDGMMGRMMAMRTIERNG